MKIIGLLCIALGVIGLIVCFINLAIIDKRQKRIEEVSKFLHMLGDMAHDYNVRHIEQLTLDKVGEVYEWFADKYTFQQLLYSSRPLTLEEWYTEEELKRIRS